MAKRKLTKVIASMEDVAVAEVANPKASLDNQVETSDSQVPTSLDPNDVSAKGGKDYTAMDAASERQGVEIAKRMERLDEAQTSLEAYLGVIKECRLQGKPFPAAAAQVMRRDLLSMYPKAFSRVGIALEDIDDSSDNLPATKTAETEGKGALSKVKGAAAAAWKKFWEWIKGLYKKFREMVAKIIKFLKPEKEKVQFLISVEKVIKEPGTVSTSKAPEPPAGMNSKAAKAITFLLEHKPDAKAEPKKERQARPPLPKTFPLKGATILESVEDDPFGVGRYESTVLNHLWDSWMPLATRIFEEIRRLMKSKSDAVETIEKEIKRYKAFPATSIMAGNYTIKRQGDGMKLSFAKTEEGGDNFEHFKFPSRNWVKTYIEINEVLLSNIERTSERWDKLMETMNVLSADADKAELDPSARQLIRTFTQDIMSSGIYEIFKHCSAVAAKRTALLDEILAIYVTGDKMENPE